MSDEDGDILLKLAKQVRRGAEQTMVLQQAIMDLQARVDSLERR